MMDDRSEETLSDDLLVGHPKAYTELSKIRDKETTNVQQNNPFHSFRIFKGGKPLHRTTFSVSSP
jgi:hypothetical protein